MSHHIIDRRQSQKGKSAGNRQRFLRRVKQQVRQAARELIREGDIKGIVDSKGKRINIPKKDLKEYQIIHGTGGERRIVHPGNKKFVQGDRVPRPQGGGQGGSGDGAGNDGEGEDSFAFELTKEEFLEIFFEDLELPDLIKQNIKAVETYKYNRAGFVNEGTPARMNIARSMKKAKGRRTALRGPKRKKLELLQEELDALEITIRTMQDNGLDCTIEKDRRVEILEEMEKLRRKIKAVPFVDELDLQYNFWEKQPVPTTQAVMFCIMDVSGSMGEWEKEMSKRFFMLLYLFLFKSYEKVDLVFIRHHSTAKEVDEEEFFYSRETGGTVVSSALELMVEIIKERYDISAWNIYACQASDGDNWGEDNHLVEDLLVNQILPLVQYYAYVELKQNAARGSDLWDTYNKIRESHSNFDTTVISNASEIFAVFRRLFEKEKGSGAK